MKLLFENWRKYLAESEKAESYGHLYLFEDDNVIKTSFYDALNTLSESDDAVNTFLENWKKSVDYQLGILKEEDSDAGPIWKLLYQSWALEQKFKAKATEKIIAVSKKINDFSEENPKTAKFAKYAVGGLLAGAAVYYIHSIVSKGGDASDVMELAQTLQPEDPDLAREVAECAQDFGPEAVAEFMQGQSDAIEKVADTLSTAGEPALEQASQAADSVAQDVKQIDALDFWNAEFEKFDANQEQWKGDPGFFADAGAEQAAPTGGIDWQSMNHGIDANVYDKYGPYGDHLLNWEDGQEKTQALEKAAKQWNEFKKIADTLDGGGSLEDLGMETRNDFRKWANDTVHAPGRLDQVASNIGRAVKNVDVAVSGKSPLGTEFLDAGQGSVPPNYMKWLRKMMRASLK